MESKSVAGTADDPTVKFASLTIDEQEYKLVWSMNALAKAERLTGINLLKGIRSNLLNPSAEELRGLLYAAMSIAQPKLTLDDVGNLIRPDTWDIAIVALIEAYTLSMPSKKSPDATASAAS